MVLAAVSSATAQDAARAVPRGPAHAQDRSFRDLLPSGTRSARRARRRRGGARLRTCQRRPAAQPGVQGPARPLQSAVDLEREPANGRGRCPRGAGIASHPVCVDVPADQWLGLSPTRSRTSSDSTSFPAHDAPPGLPRAWLNTSGAWDPERPRPPSRGGSAERHPAAHVASSRTAPRAVRRGARPCGIRLHRVALGESRHSPVPARAPAIGERRRRPYDTAFRMAAADLIAHSRATCGATARQRRRRRHTSGARRPVSGAGRRIDHRDQRPRGAQPGVHRADGHRRVGCRGALGHRVRRRSGGGCRQRAEAGQQVVITGTPAVSWNARRLVIRSLVRQSDGFLWRLPG